MRKLGDTKPHRVQRIRGERRGESGVFCQSKRVWAKNRASPGRTHTSRRRGNHRVQRGLRWWCRGVYLHHLPTQDYAQKHPAEAHIDPLFFLKVSIWSSAILGTWVVKEVQRVYHYIVSLSMLHSGLVSSSVSYKRASLQERLWAPLETSGAVS